MMESLLDYGDREEEELRRQREAAAITPPPQAPAGYGLAGSVAATLPVAPGYQPPNYDVPVPTYQENVQAMARDNPLAGQIAAGEAAASDLYGTAMPQIRDVQAQLEQRDARQGGITGVNPNQAGFRDPYVNPPNVEPGPNADFLRPLVDLYNTEIPVWTDFARDYAVPAVGGALNAMNPFSGIVNDTLGFDTGNLGANAIIPQTAGDVAVNLATGGGLTGFDDLAKGAAVARGYTDNVVRGAFPEPNLAGANYGMGLPTNPDPGNLGNIGRPGYWTDEVPGPLANPQPIQLPETPPVQRGEPAFGPGSRGGPSDTTAFDNAVRMNENLTPEDMLRAALRERGIQFDETPFNVVPAGGGSTPSSFPVPESVAGPVAATPPPASALSDAQRFLQEQDRLFNEQAARFDAANPDVPPPAAGYVPTPFEPGPALLPERTLGSPLPETSPNFTMVGGAFDTPSNASRVSGYIDAAQPRPSPTPTFPMTMDEAIAEADRIGFPIDRDALARGTPPTQAEELDRLSAAIDLNNFKNGYSSEGAALDNFVRTAREQNSAPIRPEAPPPSVNTPAQRGAWDTVMDLLYAPLSGDAGSGLRQLFSSMMNPFNLRLNSQVVGDAIKGASSRREALDVLGELDSLKAAADARIGGKNIDLHRPDIPGVRETRGLANRETLQSNTLGNIPGLGAYFNITGRGNALLLDSSRVRDYVRFIDDLPDRALSGNQSLSHWQAQAQSYADMKAVMSGRGSLGPKAVEDVLAKAGPLFTSLRYALSIPQRVPYLVPIQRIADGSWEVFGPQWREAVKEHAGFAVTLGGIYAAAEANGAEIDKDTGKIKFGGQSFDLTGGAGSYWKMVNDVAGGNYKAAADFTRNKLGPLPQAVAAGAKELGFEGAALDYMRPDWFDQGATGTGLLGRSATTLDRIGQYIVPLWIQDVAKAARAADLSGKPSLPAAAVAGLSSFFGVSTRSNVTNPRTEANNEVVEKYKGEVLDPAYSNLVKTYNDATFKEQQAILERATPAEKEAIARGEQILRDRKDIFQLSRDEEKARHDLASENRKVAEPFVQKLQEDWLAGRIDPGKAIDLLEKAEKAADAEAYMTSNMGPKLKESAAYQDAIKDFPKGEPRPLDTYYQAKGFLDSIYDSPGVRRPDGTIDYDRLKAKQDKFWATVDKEDPALAARLRYNTQPNPANNFEFTNAVKALDEKIKATGYYDAAEGTKTQFRRENPQADAMMALKYGGPVRTQAAADMLKRIAPERTVEIRK